jgi:hypothetical protein
MSIESFLKKYKIIDSQSIEDGIYTLKTIGDMDESCKPYATSLIKAIENHNDKVKYATTFIVAEQYNRGKINRTVFKEYLTLISLSDDLLQNIIGSIFPNAMTKVFEVLKDFKWKYPTEFNNVAHPLTLLHLIKVAYKKTETDRFRPIVLIGLLENLVKAAPRVNNIANAKLFEIKGGRSLFMDIVDVSRPEIEQLAKTKLYNCVLHYKHRDYVDKCM